ncbi:solute carrier organic anion transporter family member 1B1-like isoform X2 [Sorex fumeus]|nr:solute carrier organic anion transporter family member 1B1-like isoform X2 [Sorex fumeus]
MMDQNQHLDKSAEIQSSKERKSKCCNGFKMFLVALSLSYICKTLGGVVMKSSIIQIERRFEISSSVVGLIDGSFEMGNLLVIVFVSYFGSKLHRPKIIGIGCFIMGMGSILTALPHFFMGYYRYSKDFSTNTSGNLTSSLSVCAPNQNVLLNRTSTHMVGKGHEKESGSYTWVFVLLGNMLRGIGETPIGPLGISYIDDFAKKGQSSFYLGILNGVSMIGPIIGFLMGSLFFKIYVDVGYVDLSTIRITPTDSRWVGAWWLGFLVSGLLAVMSSIPFFFLPKSLHKHQGRKASLSLHQLKTNEEKHQTVDSINSSTENATASLADFFQSLKSLLTNTVYVLLLLSVLLQVSAFIGILTYVFKYLEQQYGKSASEANTVLGIISLPAVASGMFLGGYIIKRFKFTLIGNAKFSLFTSTVAFILYLSNFALLCEKKSIAGLTLTYDGNNPVASHINVPLSYCNSDCNCDQSQWEPICGSNGITYVSPCLAGCKSSSGQAKSTVLHNCSCIEEAGFKNGNNSAHLGECPRDYQCKRKFYLYVAVQSLIHFFSSLGHVSILMMFFKNVQPELKSLAVGFQSLIIRVLGGIPAPIYYGILIDKSCLKWSINPQGKQGSCRIYNSTLYGYSFLGLTMTLKFIGLVFYFLFISAMKKKYKGEGAKGLENGKEVTNKTNLDSLEKDGHLLPAYKADQETKM